MNYLLMGGPPPWIPPGGPPPCWPPPCVPMSSTLFDWTVLGVIIICMWWILRDKN